MKQKILKTHDLVKLVEECYFIDAQFYHIRNAAEILTPHATQSRYPDDYEELTKEEIEEAIECTENILSVVQQKLAC